ncbi:MAG: hypothetical protein U9O56_10110 [Campylobacterota bacterium]|nr:hypothetical protein [Campylobacterota bacterium]
MKEILDTVVWIGFAFILFIFLRGMNETQVEKHKTKLDEHEENKKTDNKTKEQ